MTDKTTYKAELIGPNPIGASEIIELEYVDGAPQKFVELSYEAGGTTTMRTWKLEGGSTEPIAYTFVGEEDMTPPNVKN